VINREDSRLATLPATAAPPLAAQVYWYGLAPHLAPRFPQDDDLYRADDLSESWANDVDGILPAATVTLTALDSTRATFDLDGSLFCTPLQLKGIYNTYNAAAALALVRVILEGEGVAGAGTGAAGVSRLMSDPHLIHTLAQIQSAFGRGEALTIDGCEIELFLVKNPGGFRLALESFDPTGHDTMIAINDEYADGRDMSWLFDVGFATLHSTGVAMVSGVRAYDMALRLHYDEVPFAAVDPTLVTATNTFLAQSAHPKRIYCTYTAMLAIRKHLATRAHLSKVV
ncbi:MAG: DUF1727 domain-containing protein, partial [Coriobacteriales bacterium]|nr:DUF1727 domain-containing protein [Coriobacteriales bacterium]